MMRQQKQAAQAKDGLVQVGCRAETANARVHAINCCAVPLPARQLSAEGSLATTQ